MYFQRISPCAELKPLVDCYWIIREESPQVIQQKIVPDGFPEVIFHFADPYRINISGTWEQQSKSLLAGQISNFFFLENTGRSNMVGIKFRPAALTHLFSLPMYTLTNRVVDIHHALPGIWEHLRRELENQKSTDEQVHQIETFLLRLHSNREAVDQPIERALQLVFEKSGLLSVQELTDHVGLSERSIQQLFKKYVGLSPKLFTRIIRFARVFEIMKEKPPHWLDVVVEAGYYDQSHFIRNFKSFTGEDPSTYGFDETTMANFFLKRP